jgi:hypothetical protein
MTFKEFIEFVGIEEIEVEEHFNAIKHDYDDLMFIMKDYHNFIGFDDNYNNDILLKNTFKHIGVYSDYVVGTMI